MKDKENIIKKIEKVISEKVRPIVSKDDGDVYFEGFVDETTVRVIYTGRCSGCPAIDWTHKRIVEPAIKGEVDEVTGVMKGFDSGEGER